MAVTLANTNASLSGKTVTVNENNDTITGNKTFDRGAATAPFTVAQATAAKVTNLDADKVDGKHSTDLLLVDGTQAMTGTLDLGTPGKVKFPASQSASADANTLDDYEEGSWTPVIGGSGGTSGQAYTTQVGRYIKIGKLVFATFTVLLSTEGTITGSAEIQGLPFLSQNTASVFGLAGSLQFASLATSWAYVNAVVLNNSQVARLRGLGAATTTGTANTTDLTAADINNTTQFVGTLIYQADA